MPTKEYYYRNREKCLAARRRYYRENRRLEGDKHTAWLRDRKRKMVEYKGGACVDCGYADHDAALQFDHRDPTLKEFNPSYMKWLSWERLTEELDKCDLVCANCHAVRTARY